MSAVLSTLGDFLRSAVRPRSRLARALVPILAIKLCIILLARLYFFDADHRIEVTPDMMNDRLGTASRTHTGES